MSFWKFRVKSDTIRVDSTGRARVDLNALFSKDHVKDRLSVLRQKTKLSEIDRDEKPEPVLARK
jgi:hypothetical protein